MPLNTVQGIVNAFRTKGVNRRLDNLLSQDPTYTQNPFAGNQFQLAQMLFNGRMAGAPQLERNIFTNQANTLNAIDRTATDASQALGAKIAAAGQTSQNLVDLQTAEQKNKYNLLNNLNNAYAAMIGEGDKVYNDKIRRYGNLVGVRGTQETNRTNAVNGIFNGINSDFNEAASLFSSFLTGGATGGIKKV